MTAFRHVFIDISSCLVTKKLLPSTYDSCTILDLISIIVMYHTPNCTRLSNQNYQCLTVRDYSLLAIDLTVLQHRADNNEQM